MENQCTVLIGSKDVKIKKKKRQMYTPGALKNAIQASNASKSLSMRDVTKTYGIPTATLARKVNNPTTLNKKSGPSTVLDANEEKEIEQWIFDRAK